MSECPFDRPLKRFFEWYWGRPTKIPHLGPVEGIAEIVAGSAAVKINDLVVQWTGGISSNQGCYFNVGNFAFSDDVVLSNNSTFAVTFESLVSEEEQ